MPSQTYPPLAPDDPRHGTPGGYTNQRCRCPKCKAAAAAGAAKRQQRPCTNCGQPCWSGTKGKTIRSGLCRRCAGLARRATEHGVAMYKRGCKCRVCRAASAKMRRESRHRSGK